ncbi:mas-related G-protein coupled receptor member A1-like [Dromiciops gliroides]|uniref:mas-related G-protein coupled receptor member A1-like n=1 Tax=Dromiciops gliroides TaxID=33562 RepID=UPI001CC5B71E|nr:mas-related G-protein coupled receptor member A1-like [Dromiciops gliroides]
MDPTIMMQISTQMPQSSVYENSSGRNTNESLFIILDNCELETFVVTINCILLVISFCGLAANGLVLWLLGFCIERNPFSFYILHLAGADFFYLCCQIVYSLTFICHNFWYIVPKTIITLTFFFYTLGLSLLTSISTERCLSVLFPIWYRCHRPKHTSAVVCSLFWTLCLLGNLLESGACGIIDFIPFSVMSCLAWDLFFVTLLLLLVCLLCVSSLTLVLKVQCYSQHRQLSKLYLLILLTVLMFLLCGLPVGIYWFLLCWLTNTSCISFVSHLLSCVNSSTNPLIYFFLGSFRQRRRREPLKVILQRALKDEPEIGKGKEISHTDIMEMSA